MLRKTASYALAILLAFALLPSCKSGTDNGSGATGDPVELKLNFRPGDKYLYSTEVKQKINMMGMSMDQNMTMEMIYSASGEEGGNKKLDITYDRIMLSMMSIGGKIDYDSRNPSGGDSSLAFVNSLVGKSFSISVAPNGDIVKVDGLSDLIGSFAAADPQTRAAMESQFSDTAVRLMMQNSFDMYPGKAVKVGESWSKKSSMSFSGISVNVENTYTLKSVADGKATVGLVSVMDLPKMNMTDQAGMTMEMKGKQEGSMEIELATGRIISGKTTQSINGKLGAGDKEMPMDINGDIVISSSRK